MYPVPPRLCVFGEGRPSPQKGLFLVDGLSGIHPSSLLRHNEFDSHEATGTGVQESQGLLLKKKLKQAVNCLTYFFRAG